MGGDPSRDGVASVLRNAVRLESVFQIAGIVPSHRSEGTTMTGADAATHNTRTVGGRLASLLVGLAVLALAVGGCGGGSAELPTRAPEESASPEVVHGEELVSQSCSACHGQDFRGVPGLGASFYDSTFIQNHTDVELVELSLIHI